MHQNAAERGNHSLGGCHGLTVVAAMAMVVVVCPVVSFSFVTFRFLARFYGLCCDFTFRVCLVWVKIIFSKNDFPILHCLVKEEGENDFPGKIDFPHLKKILFLKKTP